MFSHRPHELLVQRVLIKLVKNNLSDLRFLDRVLAKVRLQIIKLVPIALDQDQVEPLIDKEMCVASSDLRARTIDDGSVLALSPMIIFLALCLEVLRSVSPLLEVPYEAFKASVDDVFTDPVDSKAEAQVEERREVNSRPLDRQSPVETWHIIICCCLRPVRLGQAYVPKENRLAECELL
jgi:hypothetical protein